MQILTNLGIRIDQSLNSGIRSNITTYGNIAYFNNMAWEERKDLKHILEEQVNWKAATASIDFFLIEDNKEERHDHYGRICLDGRFNLHKDSGSFNIKCDCLLSPVNWNKLRNDIFAHDEITKALAFNIIQINSTAFDETTESIEAKIKIYMESYSIHFKR